MASQRIPQSEEGGTRLGCRASAITASLLGRDQEHCSKCLGTLEAQHAHLANLNITSERASWEFCEGRGSGMKERDPH